MKKITYRNSKGEPLKTTLPNHIMKQIMDITEEELINRNIFHLREGFVITVPESQIPTLLSIQREATMLLKAKGIITQEMLDEDYRQNFQS